MNNSKCIVNLDFSKAFDKVDRDYIFALLDRIGVDNFKKSAIKTIYKQTKAIIEINGYLSQTIVLERGVGQGYPLSALLFILAIEPLLCSVDNSTHIKGFVNAKTVAYADDIACLVHKSSIEALVDTVKDFGDQTQLEINVNKSEILSTTNIPFYKTLQSTKILGIDFHTDKSQPNLLGLLKTQIAIYCQFISQANTLKAKKNIIDTFILPKFLYDARHTNTTMKSLGKMQNLVNSLLKASKKMENRSEVLYQSSARGGISLPHIISKIVSAKLFEEFNSSDENSISFSKELSILIHSLKLKVVQNKIVLLFFKNNRETSLMLHNQMKTREIYWYIITETFPFNFFENRLRKAVIKHHCSTEELTRFCADIWKINKLQPQQQNLLYRLAFNCLVDKQVRWLKNFSDSPLCSFCENKFETSEHSVFECDKLTAARNILQLTNWCQIFVHMRVETLRFTASFLNGSW